MFLPESSYSPKELLARLVGQELGGVDQQLSRLSVGESSVTVLVQHLKGGQLEVGGGYRGVTYKGCQSDQGQECLHFLQ